MSYNKNKINFMQEFRNVKKCLEVIRMASCVESKTRFSSRNLINFLEIRKRSLLILMIVCLFGLISCQDKTVNCPEFEEEILKWIPYQENEEVVLYSQSQDSTITLLINGVNVTHTTHYTIGAKCGTCDDQIVINSYDDSSFQVEMYLNSNKIVGQSFRICDTYFSESNSTYSELTNFLFEDKEYDTVRVFEKNDSQGVLKKLIIAKGIGVIGVMDINNNIWSLKTNDKNKQGNAVISRVSCE